MISNAKYTRAHGLLAKQVFGLNPELLRALDTVERGAIEYGRKAMKEEVVRLLEAEGQVQAARAVKDKVKP